MANDDEPSPKRAKILTTDDEEGESEVFPLKNKPGIILKLKKKTLEILPPVDELLSSVDTSDGSTTLPSQSSQGTNGSSSSRLKKKKSHHKKEKKKKKKRSKSKERKGEIFETPEGVIGSEILSAIELSENTENVNSDLSINPEKISEKPELLPPVIENKEKLMDKIKDLVSNSSSDDEDEEDNDEEIEGDEEDEEEEIETSNPKTSSQMLRVKTKKKGGKKKKGNLRKNIREIQGDDKLEEETKAAQREEAERLERMKAKQQQQMLYMQQQQQLQHQEFQRSQEEEVAKSRYYEGHYNNSHPNYEEIMRRLSEKCVTVNASPGSSIDRVRIERKLPPGMIEQVTLSSDSDDDIIPIPSSSSTQRSSELYERLSGRTEFLSQPSTQLSPGSSFGSFNTAYEDFGPIEPLTNSKSSFLASELSTRGVTWKSSGGGVLTQDEMKEEEEQLAEEEKTKEDSDDDCILLSPGEYVDEVEKSEDAHNIPDEFGRVLVNVGHPDGEPDIFLPSKIASAVKPHQIGGIRFLYDNVIESLERYKNSHGFGCILAHSMGLGKTLQAVAFSDIFLRNTGGKSILVIVPINTIQNWLNEFKFWLPKKNLDQGGAETGRRNGNVEGEAFEDSTKSGDLCHPLAELTTSEKKHDEDLEFNVYVLNETVKTLAARERIIQKWSQGGGVMLLGYEMYRMLAQKKMKRSGGRRGRNFLESSMLDEAESLERIYEAVVRPGPDLVICDEGHRIKNSGAGISQALKAIRTRRRVVLTGYPLQNNLMEYWCMVDFVRPNYLGSKVDFSNMFERPIMNGQCVDSTFNDRNVMRYRSHVLHTLLEGFVQRRSHLVLQAALPPKQEWVFLLKMSHIQNQLYKAFIHHLRHTIETVGQSGANPIKAFAVCCKIWNHPDALYKVVKRVEDMENSKGILNVETPLLEDLDLDEVSGAPKKAIQQRVTSRSEASVMNLLWASPVFAAEKYEAGKLENGVKFILLLKIVQECIEVGDKVLVFSQSLMTLDLIELFLGKKLGWGRGNEYFRLDGSTSGLERERLIGEFNDKLGVILFLVSTRAGSLGINLIGANRVIVFDASWNPCHDTQAVCRVYRYGQRKQCQIYRFVTDSTLEKRIYDRQINKRGMADRVVDEMNPDSHLSSKDISSFLLLEDEIPIQGGPTFNIENFSDSVLKNVISDCSGELTKEPFEHESLLIDRKDKKLSASEKRQALKLYEIEKKNMSGGSNSGYNYHRPSYAPFYSKDPSSAQTTPQPTFTPFDYSAIANSQMNFPSSRHGPSAADVNNLNSSFYSQMKSPFPQHPSANHLPPHGFPGGFSENKYRTIYNSPHRQITDREKFNQQLLMLRQKGVSVQFLVLKKDSFLADPNGGPDIYLRAGEKVWVIRSSKGSYLRLSNGRIIAIRKSSNPLTYPTSGGPIRDLSPEQLHSFVYSLLKNPRQMLAQDRGRRAGAEPQLISITTGQDDQVSIEAPKNHSGIPFTYTGRNNLEVRNFRSNSGGNVTLWNNDELRAQQQHQQPQDHFPFRTSGDNGRRNEVGDEKRTFLDEISVIPIKKGESSSSSSALANSSSAFPQTSPFNPDRNPSGVREGNSNSDSTSIVETKRSGDNHLKSLEQISMFGFPNFFSGQRAPEEKHLMSQPDFFDSSSGSLDLDLGVLDSPRRSLPTVEGRNDLLLNQFNFPQFPQDVPFQQPLPPTRSTASTFEDPEGLTKEGEEETRTKNGQVEENGWNAKKNNLFVSPLFNNFEPEWDVARKRSSFANNFETQPTHERKSGTMSGASLFQHLLGQTGFQEEEGQRRPEFPQRNQIFFDAERQRETL